MKIIPLLLLALLFLPCALMAGAPLYTSTVAAQTVATIPPTTAFKIGVNVGGKLTTYTISFFVTSEANDACERSNETPPQAGPAQRQQQAQ